MEIEDLEEDLEEDMDIEIIIKKLKILRKKIIYLVIFHMSNNIFEKYLKN